MGHYTIDRGAVASLPAHPSIDHEVNGCADDILAEAREHIMANPSYETGHMYESGFVDGHSSEYQIGFTAPYSHFVELGTRYMDAEPFLTPAATRLRGEL